MTDDDLIFEVKGVIHPNDRIIAYLRYIRDGLGDRQSGNGTKFRKVYDLSRREKELKENYPHYLWFDETRGRVFQSVPRNRISFVLNPVDSLRQLRDMGGHVSNLERASRNLAGILVDNAGIDWDDLGLTGSQLVGLASQQSDIDLVVYGEGPGKKLHEALKGRKQDFEGLEQYNGEQLDSHLEFRWGGKSKWKSELRSIEASKVFQGMFESYDFFIRAVKLPSEINQKYEDLLVRNEGIVSVRCIVTQDSDSIFTPCSYLVECDDHPELMKLVSYRGRFTEHVSGGMSVEARGRLESVRNVNTGEEFMQVVLGESRDDYLIPV